MAHHNEFTIAHLKDAAGKVELETADAGALRKMGDESSGEELITVEKGYHDVIVDLPKEERTRVLRKVDYRLVPFLAFLYLIAFVDRSNIGNAKIAGLEDRWNIDQGLRCTYTDGQKGNSNHVVATWSLTMAELALFCNSVVLDIC